MMRVFSAVVLVFISISSVNAQQEVSRSLSPDGKTTIVKYSDGSQKIITHHSLTTKGGSETLKPMSSNLVSGFNGACANAKGGRFEYPKGSGRFYEGKDCHPIPKTSPGETKKWDTEEVIPAKPTTTVPKQEPTTTVPKQEPTTTVPKKQLNGVNDQLTFKKKVGSGSKLDKCFDAKGNRISCTKKVNDTVYNSGAFDPKKTENGARITLENEMHGRVNVDLSAKQMKKSEKGKAVKAEIKDSQGNVIGKEKIKAYNGELGVNPFKKKENEKAAKQKAQQEKDAAKAKAKKEKDAQKALERAAKEKNKRDAELAKAKAKKEKDAQKALERAAKEKAKREAKKK